MRTTRIIACLTVLALCGALLSGALAETPLSTLWKSGCDLLFHTDNVTVTGEAVFSLDGVRFKTARLHYIQDEFRSLYDLKLLTPQKSGAEQETGWTIIGDGHGVIYVMEAYTPGIYRTMSDYYHRHNTLLRRSVGLDALVELGGAVVPYVEQALPEGAVIVTEQDGAASIAVSIVREQVPQVAQNALSVGLSFLADRWFRAGLDEAAYTAYRFEDHRTVTWALLSRTERWSLGGLDAVFALDAHGRLTGAAGELRIISTDSRGTEREIEVTFSLEMTNYDASAVMRFNPTEWGAVPKGSVFFNRGKSLLDGKQLESLTNAATNIFASQGFSIQEKADWDVSFTWHDGVSVIQAEIRNPNGTKYLCAFTGDGTGRLMLLREKKPAWEAAALREADDVDEETVAAAKALASSFAQAYHPEILQDGMAWSVRGVKAAEDGSRYLLLEDPGHPGEAPQIVIRIAPSLRVEWFDCLVRAYDPDDVSG